MNVTKNQLITALEYCADGLCDLCPYMNAEDPDSCCCVKYDALELIKSQDQKIKKLTAEVERLRDYNENLLTANTDAFGILQAEVANATVDTVNNIRAMFEVHFGTYTDRATVKIKNVFKLLDQTAKELLK